MEANDSMTAKSWLCTGWQTYWKNKWVLALGGLLWFAWDLTLVCRKYLLCGIGIPLPFFIIWDGLCWIISVGLCFFCLKLSRGLEAPFSTIFEGFRRWWTVLVTVILLGLIFAAGFILLVAPGIILALKYLLALYAVMDRRLSACKALQLSGRITTGHKGQLFYTVLISYGPALVLGVGATILCVFFPSNFSTCLVMAACLVIGCVLDPWAACSLAVAYDRLSK